MPSNPFRHHNFNLPVGAITECGIPSGTLGRLWLLPWLGREQHSLWIYPRHLHIHAPAWTAQGVDLRRTHFLPCPEKLSDLRPLFMNHAYPLIVFDQPPRMRPEDLAFLRHQARIHHYALVIIRDYLLSPRRGNPFARLRFNAWFSDRQIQIRIVRGIPQSNIQEREDHE